MRVCTWKDDLKADMKQSQDAVAVAVSWFGVNIGVMTKGEGHDRKE